MASLRDVGEKCALVLSLYEGQNFSAPQDSEGSKLLIAASLDSKESVESDPVQFIDENPEFNTELVWTMDRVSFQAIRSRKVQLKMQVLDASSKRVIGYHIFDLREAVPKAEIEANESYLVHASWRKITVQDLPPGRVAPSIRAALVIEPAEIPNDFDMNDDDTMNLTNRKLNNNERLTPILDNEKGYFTIGHESPQSQIFLFNIFICFANNVHEAFPKDMKADPGEKLFFVYDLFGTQISSRPFTCSGIHEFKPERATAKIFASPQTLVRFFNEKLANFAITIQDEKQNILAVADQAKLFTLKVDELKAGKLAVFEGVIPLVPAASSGSNSPFHGSTKAMSDSALNNPNIGVRFSIGSHPDAALAIEPTKTLKQDLNVEASNVLWAPIASRPSNDDHPPTTSIPQTEELHKHTDDTDADITVMSDCPPPELELSKLSSSEPVLRYKFTIDLKDISLNIDHPVNCVIKYKYKPFCSTEVSTWPSFQVNSGSEKQEIRRGYCEYSFTARESAVRKPLDKHPLHIRVYNIDTHLGTASINLSSLFSQPSANLGTRTCSVHAPIWKTNKLGSNEMIGTIFCTFSIKELPTATSGVPIPSSKSAFNTIATNKNNSSSLPNVDKIALEIEQWKHKQKEAFKNQLQQLESHHINMLTKEWEKREKERENLVHKKLTEILTLEKDLKQALESNKQKQKALETFEQDLNARQRKLDDREQRLQILLGKNTSNKKGAVTTDLAKESEALKTEIDIWKTKYEALKCLSDEMAPLKKELAKLKSENVGLQKSLLAASEKSAHVEKIRDFYKNAFEEAEAKVKQLQQEKDLTLVSQLAALKEENAKLKADSSKSRDLYEAKLVRMAMKMVDTPANLAISDEEASTSSQITVVNAKDQKEILRLKKQKELFLNTKVYKEGDEIIKLIDAKISELSRNK